MRLKDYVEKRLREDPEFARAWEDTEPEFQLACELLRLRRQLNLTQAEFASKVEMPQSVIARLESGQHRPSFKTLTRIARKLGLNLRVSFEPEPQRT